MTYKPWEDYHRLPDLGEAGKIILKKMVQHPQAPLFRNSSGHFLRKSQQEKLKQQEAEEAKEIISPDLSREEKILKIKIFIWRCQSTVPFYKEYNWKQILDSSPNVASRFQKTFQKIPTITRKDIQSDITQFVPNDLPLDQLIAFTTNGTTGHPIIIPSHPEVAAAYSWFHKKALRWNGVEPDNFTSDVAVLLAGYQQQCFTYVSLIHSLNNKGLIKTNFHPADWPSPESRAIYLEDMAPDVITGDPLSLYELMQLNSQHKPKAVLSTSMALMPEQQKVFEDYWQCPVINIYSMNEAGPIATSVGGEKGLRLLQSSMLVEILDENDNPQSIGQRGEITLTHAINDYLPLLRYRTGDYAWLQERDGYWYLMDLEGRPPVKYKTAAGHWLNNVDITHALQAFALPQYTFHQASNQDITMRIRGDADTTAIGNQLQKIFGSSIKITIHSQQTFADKVIQYTSDLHND